MPDFDRPLSLDLDWIAWRLDGADLTLEECETLLAIKADLERHIPASTDNEN